MHFAVKMTENPSKIGRSYAVTGTSEVLLKQCGSGESCRHMASHRETRPARFRNEKHEKKSEIRTILVPDWGSAGFSVKTTGALSVAGYPRHPRSLPRVGKAQLLARYGKVDSCI